MDERVLSPVLIATYSRLEHLKKTITTLQKNVLAEQTDLYIASDYQQSETDAQKVAEVREYLKVIDGFKSVTIFSREKNLGAAENTFSALDIILAKHDRFILMEDDIVTAPGFLSFINKGFDKYGDNEKLFSITGYCPPITIPATYGYDAIFLGRMNAWGCALTKEKYESVPRHITKQEYNAILSNKKLRASIARNGQDLPVMLNKMAEDSLDAWDVRCMYIQFVNNQYTLYPSQSLVQNIGFDGTGQHCGKTKRWDVSLRDKTTFNFPTEVSLQQTIVKRYQIFMNEPFNRSHYSKRMMSAARGVAGSIMNKWRSKKPTY